MIHNPQNSDLLFKALPFKPFHFVSTKHHILDNDIVTISHDRTTKIIGEICRESPNEFGINVTSESTEYNLKAKFYLMIDEGDSISLLNVVPNTLEAFFFTLHSNHCPGNQIPYKCNITFRCGVIYEIRLFFSDNPKIQVFNNYEFLPSHFNIIQTPLSVNANYQYKIQSNQKVKARVDSKPRLLTVKPTSNDLQYLVNFYFMGEDHRQLGDFLTPAPKIMDLTNHNSKEINLTRISCKALGSEFGQLSLKLIFDNKQLQKFIITLDDLETELHYDEDIFREDSPPDGMEVYFDPTF